MHTQPQQTLNDVRAVLQQFQDGYTRRETLQLDEFMKIFASGWNVEMIGTGALTPGDDEWAVNLPAVRNLIESDWIYWGDVKLDIEGARVLVHGETAWITTRGTVTRNLKAETNYQNTLDTIQQTLKQREELLPEERLLEVLRSGVSALYEARQGDEYIWPLRFTAVLVQQGVSWRFAKIQFSFATKRFPDVRQKADKKRG